MMKGICRPDTPSFRKAMERYIFYHENFIDKFFMNRNVPDSVFEETRQFAISTIFRALLKNGMMKYYIVTISRGPRKDRELSNIPRSRPRDWSFELFMMKRITPEQRWAQIAAKLASGVRLPPPELMRNSGRRRTPEKKALLERIAKNSETPSG